VLTIALNKGRILKSVLPLLAKAGIEPLENLPDSRQLLIPATDPNIRMIVMRSQDVPVFVARGVAEIGITGKDSLLEAGAHVLHFYEPVDLGLARCRLVRAVPANAPAGNHAPVRVATKYERTAKRFYLEAGRQAEIIKLHGAIEIAPLVGLADEIIDIADTGNTLKANGLIEKDLIAEISARLIVNKAALKRRFKRISGLVEAIEQEAEASGKA